MTTRLIRVKYLDDRNRPRIRLERVCACPACGAVVATDDYDENDGHAWSRSYSAHADEWVGLRRRYCQAPHPRRVWDAEKGKHVEQHFDDDGQAHVCGAPLFEESDLRRMPAATMVKRARGFFGLLVIDEMHKAKAKGTGVGWALTVLSGACRFTLGATGTLFGGYSTSIFWLMYRLSGEVRRRFGYSDDRRWVDHLVYSRRRSTSRMHWSPKTGPTRAHGNTCRYPSRFRYLARHRALVAALLHLQQFEGRSRSAVARVSRADRAAGLDRHDAAGRKRPMVRPNWPDCSNGLWRATARKTGAAQSVSGSTRR